MRSCCVRLPDSRTYLSSSDTLDTPAAEADAPQASGQAALDRIRAWLFCLTGASLPFFAFPPLGIAGKPVDLATLLASLFVLASLPAFARRPSRPLLGWLGAAAAVPVLVLASDAARAPTFDLHQLAFTYAHWLLVASFFATAAQIQLGPRQWRWFVRTQVAAGLAVTFFCFYQLVGRPLGWAATGHLISPLQRQPFVGGTFAGYERPTSFLLEPSYLGAYLAWLALLPLSVVIDAGRQSRTRVLHGAALVAFVAAIVASGSLGAYVDVAVLGGLMLIHAWASPQAAVRRRLAFVLGGVLVATIAADTALRSGPSNALRTRLDDMQATLHSGRYEELGTHRAGAHLRELRVAVAHPVTGVGLGQYRLMSRTVPGKAVGTPHVVSGWLGAAAEMGAPGVAVLVAALVLARRRNRSLLVTLLVGYAVVNQLHFASYVELSLWYPLAVCAIAARRNEPRAGSRSRRATACSSSVP